MRFLVVVVAGLVALSIALRLDMLPGAGTAGVVVRLLLCRASEDDRRLVETKLEAVGFGFVVPVFFIARGLSLDST